jgi:Flp pilus assembly protein protease CpaA
LTNQIISGKKFIPICLIVFGIIIATPFNFMTGMDGAQADLIWLFAGMAMVGYGIYKLKKEARK